VSPGEFGRPCPRRVPVHGGVGTCTSPGGPGHLAEYSCRGLAASRPCRGGLGRTHLCSSGLTTQHPYLYAGMLRSWSTRTGVQLSRSLVTGVRPSWSLVAGVRPSWSRWWPLCAVGVQRVIRTCDQRSFPRQWVPDADATLQDSSFRDSTSQDSISQDTVKEIVSDPKTSTMSVGVVSSLTSQ
jgi:hypothetical protein